MKIALLGFMGTGKSSIGKLLAEKINFKFIDTDKYIEKKTGLSIPEIFSDYGEKHFRQLESKYLKEISDMEDDLVIATGGGIILSAQNRELLKLKTFPILLTASPQVIYQRTRKGERPLLRTDDPFAEIRRLLKERTPYYREFINSIDTDGKDKQQIVEEILNTIK